MKRSELALLAVPVLIGLAPSIIWPVPFGRLLATAVAALVLGFAVMWLPRIVWAVGLWVLGTGGVLILGGLHWQLGICWFLLFGAASALGGHVVAGVRSPRARTANTSANRRAARSSATGSPPGEPELRLRVEGDPETELADPTEAAMLAAVGELDGQDRSMVSLFRGRARLDLAGDAAGAMMVYHCGDRSARPPVWSQLTTPDAGEAKTPVRVAGFGAEFEARLTTTIEPAREAARVFRGSGARAPGLHWRTDPDVADLRPFPETE